MEAKNTQFYVYNIHELMSRPEMRRFKIQKKVRRSKRLSPLVLRTLDWDDMTHKYYVFMKIDNGVPGSAVCYA